jgi:hypothetical protein
MDITFWQNINALGEKTQLIEKIVTLKQFNLIIDGYSMFHYFCRNAEVIDIIKKLYLHSRMHGCLDPEEINLPM